ncbi:Serine/threonine-protein kinase PrkC [Planctomycetes bacterium Poly30]|uniref:Serine/threonine-protein kinase PrkC n=1 Tax=Saltatorellus ferox TaxID=2528018 RepID=A0A518ESZ0_9BACT|nr:Serine/threonine-protein kinase PrkC [Planctomycetes bacterium Poly30]
MLDRRLRSRAKEIFLDALEKPPERRGEFIARATAGDQELGGAVEQLLDGHSKADAIAGWFSGPPQPEDGLSVGEVLGNYELLAELDSGSDGRVFRARQEGLDREVALKVPGAGRFASAAEVTRFRREAEAVARLDHPGIVPVYDVDEVDGRHFFSMKLIEGGSLASRMAEFSLPEAAAGLVEKVARAVHHAHQRGILHRDIKPSNILLSHSSLPVVADFGIAAKLGARAETSRLAVAGTPAYMAPEQAMDLGEPTTATDVWGLGCVLFELLEGSPPFRGSSVTDSLRRAREESTPMMARAHSALFRGRAADLEAIVRKCLQKDPANRYASAGALAEDLGCWLSHHPVSVRIQSPIERLQSNWRRQPFAYTLAAALALLVLCIAILAPLVSIELRRRLDRAQFAEEVARTRLRSALLAQSKATRTSDSPGRRENALVNLAEAAAIAPSAALRDEAIRVLARPDLVVTAEFVFEPEADVALCVSGDGQFVVLANQNGPCRVVDLSSGETQSVFVAPHGRVRYARLSPDGGWMLARSQGEFIQDGPKISLVDLDTGQARRTWEEGGTSIRFAFDPTGRSIALLFEDSRLEVVSCETLQTVMELEVTSLSDIQFGPDGKTLYAATGEGRSLLGIDLLSGTTRRIVEDLSHPTSTIDIDPAGERIVVGYYAAEAQIFGLASGRLVSRCLGHAAEVATVEFLDAGRAATSAWDGMTRTWDTMTGQPLLEWPGQLLTGSDGTRGVLVTALGGRLTRHSISPSPLLVTLGGHEGKSPRGLACSADGTWVATGAVDGVRFWNVSAGTLLLHIADTREVSSMAASGNGAFLYMSNGAGVQRIDVRAALSGGSPECEQIIVGETGDLAVSWDGRRLAVVRPQERVEVYDIDRGLPRLLRTLEAPGRVAGLSLSPDGFRLVSGAWRGRGVRGWNTDTGEVLFDRLADCGQVRVVFDASGDRVLATTPGALQVWDQEGQPLFEERYSNRRSFRSAGHIAADAGRRWMAAVVDRDTIELRDARTFKIAARLWSDGVPLQSLLFVPGASLLVAGSTDGRAMVWDLQRMEVELAKLGLALESWPRRGRPLVQSR